MPKASKNTPGSSAAGKERPIHPYSRKALKLNKQQIHEKKLEGAKSNTKVKTELIAEKVKWFQQGVELVHSSIKKLEHQAQGMRRAEDKLKVMMKSHLNQDNLDDRHLYTKQDMIDLVMEYRNRFAEELEQINIVQAVGNRQTQSRQHASREAAIKITMEEETHQFEGSGMEVPDLINKKHLDDLRKWNGDLNQIQNLKFRKISAFDIRRLEQKSEDNKS